MSISIDSKLAWLTVLEYEVQMAGPFWAYSLEEDRFINNQCAHMTRNIISSSKMKNNSKLKPRILFFSFLLYALAENPIGPVLASNV